jgi:hypothetical protein
VIWSVDGVPCLDITASNSYASWVIATIPQSNSARTNMCWIRWNSSWGYPAWQYWTSGYGKGDVIYTNNWITWSQYWWALWSYVATPWVRYHVAVTTSGGAVAVYVNWTQTNSWSTTINTNWTTLYLWHCTWDNSYCNWYIADMIIENITRTATEISDYYNVTKSKYWY